MQLSLPLLQPLPWESRPRLPLASRHLLTLSACLSPPAEEDLLLRSRAYINAPARGAPCCAGVRG